MNIKNEFHKFSKSIVDSTNILVKVVNFDSMAKGLKDVQNTFSDKLEQCSKSIDEHIKASENSQKDSASANSRKTEDLNLSASIKKVLIENGLDTEEKIRLKSDDELLSLKGIGAKALEQIKSALDN